MTGDEVAAVHELRESVEALSVAVAELSSRVSVTEDTQKAIASQKQVNTRLTISIAFNVLLLAFIGFLLWQVDQNAEQIDSVQRRTSNTVLCPLYQLLVDQSNSLPDNAADENQDGVTTPEEQQKLDHTVEVIRAGYAALDCRHS